MRQELRDRIAGQVPALRCFAHKLTRERDAADDLVQACLERALARQHLWQEGTDLKAWLFTILRNQFVNQVRHAASRQRTVDICHVEPLLNRSGGQDARLTLRDLRRALAQLPERQRRVILLIGLGGMSYKSAAKVMDCPVGTVRSRLCRGREALDNLMNGITDDDLGKHRSRRITSGKISASADVGVSASYS